MANTFVLSVYYCHETGHRKMREKTLAYLYFGLRYFCIGTFIYGNGIDLESTHLAEHLVALEISLLLRISLIR